MLPKILLSLILLSLALPVEYAPARSLYWRLLDVEARLDRDGRLHVRESQTMVFDGDWNGGERRFNLRPGQRLDFARLLRHDPTSGTYRELRSGPLDQVDNYGWHSQNTLRWRSRLPSDPPFAGQAITYVLEYSLGGIVSRQGTGYLLDHDFVFPERSGRIEKARVRLDLDPVWQGRIAFPVIQEMTALPPGQGLVIALDLQHAEGNPAEIAATSAAPVRQRPKPPLPAPAWLGPAMSAILWLTLALLAIRFFRHERRLGRFDPLPAVEAIDRDWLQAHVFRLPPEVVGAAWDKQTSHHEVAAVIARLVQENKITSRVEEFVLPLLNIRIRSFAVLHMRLNIPRQHFTGYERRLIDGLFIAGDSTDTRTIRKHYRNSKTSFNPASELAEPLGRQVEQLTRDRKNPLAYNWMPPFLLAVLSFFLLLANGFLHRTELTVQVTGLVLFTISWICGGVTAWIYRNRSTGRTARILFFSLFAMLPAAGIALLASLQFSTLGLTGFFVLAMAVITTIFNLAMARDDREGVLLCQQLTSARRFFQRELAKEQPDLEDAWFPYLMAFGLGDRVDAWFRQFGSTGPLSGPAGSSGSGSAGFTGGGGLFGGGGASGAWMAAAQSVAAGAASSSSSGGGGGSSGGGGGGGW